MQENKTILSLMCKKVNLTERIISELSLRGLRCAYCHVTLAVHVVKEEETTPLTATTPSSTYTVTPKRQMPGFVIRYEFNEHP